MANNKTEASPGVLSFQMTNEKKKNHVWEDSSFPLYFTFLKDR